MERITSKEKILKKVRQALNYKSKNPYHNLDLESSIYQNVPEMHSLERFFTENFIATGGTFIYCDNEFDLIDKLISLLEQRKWKHFFCEEEALQFRLKDSGIIFKDRFKSLDKIQAAISTCEVLIARTGSILFSSSQNTRNLPVIPQTLVVIAGYSQMVLESKEAFVRIRNRYGKNLPHALHQVSGPVKSAAIGMNPIKGGSGPGELILFLLNDSKRV